MAAATPFNSFQLAVNSGAHDLVDAQIAITLCASDNAPVASNSVLSDITPISLTNVSTSLDLTTSSAGTVLTNGFRLVVADLMMTASGGDVGPFRYVVAYNKDTDDLICFWDLEDNITVADGNSMNWDFSQVTGLYQVTSP